MSNKTSPQKQKMKTYIIYAVIIFIGLLLIWFIFSGGDSDAVALQEKEKALKKELPAATPDEMPESKVDLYELDEGNNYFGINDDITVADMDIVAIEEDDEKKKEREEVSYYAVEKDRQNSLMEAQRFIDQKSKEIDKDKVNNDTLDNNSDNNNEKSEAVLAAEQRKAELEAEMELLRSQQELNRQIEEMTTKKTVGNDEIKSSNSEQVVMPVKKKIQNVSVLRRNSFNGVANEQERKTIKATAYGKQIVKTDQNVRLRLSEPMLINNVVIPKNTIVTGRCAVGTDRLFINVESIQYNDIIYPVQLKVYDIDGTLGLYVPGSLENDALKEIATEVANSVGNSAQQAQSNYINNQSAVEQVKSDVYRGGVGGVARYIGKKLSEIKISVQDGQQCYLMF
jgi:conjugative transposon TraM protein